MDKVPFENRLGTLSICLLFPLMKGKQNAKIHERNLPHLRCGGVPCKTVRVWARTPWGEATSLSNSKTIWDFCLTNSVGHVTYYNWKK